MLRPKQLLPLIKASQRSWILAGTSAGSRTGDGPCNPHGLSTADEKDDHIKRTPHIPHPGHEVSVITPINYRVNFRGFIFLLWFNNLSLGYLLNFFRFHV